MSVNELSYGKVAYTVATRMRDYLDRLRLAVGTFANQAAFGFFAKLGALCQPPKPITS